MHTLLRFKFDENAIIEIDPSAIKAFKIDERDDGSYYLSLLTNTAEYILEHGNRTICYEKLNKLHNILDCHIRDV